MNVQLNSVCCKICDNEMHHEKTGVTTQLMSTFDTTTPLLWLYRTVCIRHGQKLEDSFSREAAHYTLPAFL